MIQPLLSKKYFFSFLAIFLIIKIFNSLNETQDFAIAPLLEINKSVNDPTPLTGDTITYTLQYRCASLTEDCNGMMITDPLPPNVIFAGLIGSPHTTNESYNPSNHTVTFNFQDPIIAGTIGEVKIDAFFPNGITPDGSTASNTATISATNAVNVTSNAVITIASAEDKMDIYKFHEGGTLDNEMVFTIQVCDHEFTTPIENGTLSPTFITVRDTLPPTATFVSAENGVYDSNSHTVEWTYYLDTMALDQCWWPQVFVEFSSVDHSIGDTISNTGYVSYTPIGGSPITFSSTTSVVFNEPLFEVGLIKDVANSTRLPGETNEYTFSFWNDSNISIDSFYIIDTIPDYVIIDNFTLGNFYANSNSSNLEKTIKYTTNLDTTWTTLPGSPFQFWNNSLITVDDLGLATNEHLTKLIWEFGPDPMPFSSGLNTSQPIQVLFHVDENAPEGGITNCIIAGGADSTAIIINENNNTNCATFTVLPGANGFVPRTGKEYNPKDCNCWTYFGSGDFFNPGDTIPFRLRVGNYNTATANIDNPAIADLLPIGLTYINGSWNQDENGTSAPAPIFSLQNDYNGTGREHLSWEWSGFSFAPGEEVFITFDVIVGIEAPNGEDILINEFAMLQNSNDGCNSYTGGYEKADTDDLDGDGNTTELFCFSYTALDIASVVSIESEKLVKGQLDTVYSKYPNIANSVPGGIADYQLIIRNKGNVLLDSIIIIDILPFVGDMGVIDLSNRDSRWRPNLVAPVNTPSGVTTYYSLEENPCRSIEQIVLSGPSGCTTPNWTTIPPSDITTVQSLKFELGSTILYPNDSLTLEWPMRVPVNALTTLGNPPDTIAWNSFGYIGQRVDNSEYTLASEPVKVGIALEEINPGSYGDFVWIDTNQDGIQDASEIGYDGLRVELYLDDGDGIADLATDSLVSFNITANGGFYLFPNLPEGDYFTTFYLPPTYQGTLVDIGGDDDVDSDGTAGTYNGFSIATTEITNITNTEIDFSWDLGIFQSGNSAIGNYVWEDINEDGNQNESIADGVNGIVVNLYDNTNPTIILATTTTSNDVNGNPGYYLFDQIVPGDYFIEVELPEWASFTTQGTSGSSDPVDSDVNLIDGRTEVFNVATNIYDDSWDAAIIMSNFDYGDGPSNYPAVWHHSLVDADGDNILDGTDNIWLGTKTNFEIDQKYSSTASMDGFDDGITFGSGIGDFPMTAAPSTSYDIDIMLNATNSSTVYYGMWIDWDNDGVYEDFYNGSETVSGATNATVSISTPSYTSIGSVVNVRLRVDDEQLIAADYQGGKSNGEVEDYQATVVLPLELTSFKAIANNCDVDLRWTTLSETDFSHFEVEWSETGKDFVLIDMVPSNGNSSNELKYLYRHPEAKQLNYYRLKMVDLDGSFVYSDQIFVDTECQIEIKKLNIYPNPIGLSKNILNLSFNSSAESHTKITITDMAGLEKLRFPIIAFEGENNLGIDIQNLAAGTYIISIDNSKSPTKSKQFIKVSD